jgi:Tol biopolymer transport system component
MGEVYRARDSRLQRDVAIKVLPEGVARDPDQRARFEREAQAVAALSHPNVVAIFDTGSHGDHLYAVTELLTGQTLRDRLRSGSVPIAKAIDWAVQIARGLAAAHDKQLVHRDLKPENIFITTDGHVKILDFGLAKATIAGKADAETVPAVTGAGVILGTVGYMAPEQVRGHLADARADLFAFGAVLYEMLTGERAFRRDTPAETMTAILREEPASVTTGRADAPPALDRIVRHCLEKDPHERFQSARDVAFALETLSGPAPVSNATGARSASAMAGAPAVRPPLRRIISGAIVVASLIAGGFWAASHFGLFSRGGTAAAAPITLGAATQLTTEDGLEIDAALSPDGKMLAYSAGQATGMRIFIRAVAGGRTLTLSEGRAAVEYQPRWSPDGSQILFLTPDGVFVASALGGASKRVASGIITSATWAPDGKRVLLARPAALAVAPLDGGAERPLVDGGVELHSCSWSPLDDWVACASGNIFGVIPGLNFGNVAPSAIVLVSTAGGAIRTVADRTSANLSPTFSPDGHHLYFVSNRAGPRDIYAVDLRGVGAGDPPPPVRITTGMGVQSISFAARSTRLAYVSYTARANIWTLPIPAGGAVNTSAAKALTAGSQIVESLRLSPDRQWLVFDSTLNLNAEIFRMPIQGGAVEQLTNDPADEFAPDLSPDGREVTYHSWKTGTRDIYVKALDSGVIQAVTATPGQESYPRWSLDGNRISYVDQTGLALGTSKAKLFVVRRQSGGVWSTPVLISDMLTQAQGAWLRDGRLVYGTARGIETSSEEGGPPQIVYALSAAADPEPRSIILSDDGRLLYFKSRNVDGRSTIWSVPVAGGKPTLLVTFADLSRPSIRPDFAAGAGRFFFTLEDRQADIWIAEVTKR